MSGEWGPWIEHDGSGCPLRVGQFVHIEYPWARYVGPVLPGFESDPARWEVTGVPNSSQGYVDSWEWSQPGPCQPVQRYRIRKPLGLVILEEQLQRIEAPQRDEVPA
ncbi:hypothetical protein SAMN05444007_108235 [Cribrihabitans marinus]|uniref:Uncharacterized protein n=1 Tax=Cribrihabitans marinus TaxID=1227549 RepID=A0A1H7CNT9_9RHOB|nr:hypothetical protein [Cribrihabitans marinus]GGH36206.1 hypothetical protein GCM10010973_30030 [Cribrihabitans marinus]SEJ91309.1 hypothetical protein SAMN05444007_108235 [Cribrihabitans marinus]